MNTMKQTIAVMAVALVGLLTVNASYGVHETSIAEVTVVVWEEDFESYAAGTAIQDTAKWATSAADGPIRINGYSASSDLGQRRSAGLSLHRDDERRQVADNRLSLPRRGRNMAACGDAGRPAPGQGTGTGNAE